MERVLLDDRKARRIAREHGLLVVGTAGALLLAKEQGILATIAPILDALQTAGLYLAEAAYQQVVALAGEWDGSDR
ncbi:MAG: DUF3368 domain-containing protein [Chloroflexota bacterium]